MKRKFTSFIPVLLIAVVLFSGCVDNKNSAPVPSPTGTFKGQFRLLHRMPGATKIDTTKADIQLVLEPGVGFKVLGDTLTVHAGSKGHYGTSQKYMAFEDETYPKTGIPAKTHLNGYYDYYYDGSTVLQMVANSSDTLSLQYDLKRAQ